jgi:hypothetical protein
MNIGHTAVARSRTRLHLLSSGCEKRGYSASAVLLCVHAPCAREGSKREQGKTRRKSRRLKLTSRCVCRAYIPGEIERGPRPAWRLLLTSPPRSVARKLVVQYKWNAAAVQYTHRVQRGEFQIQFCPRHLQHNGELNRNSYRGFTGRWQPA